MSCSDNPYTVIFSIYADKSPLMLTFSFYFLQLWRVSESEFQFRTFEGHFLTYDGESGFISATKSSPSRTETFYVERNFSSRVHIRNMRGTYLQVTLMVH